MKRRGVWLVACILALLAFIGAGPYLTVRSVRIAVQAQDAAALSRQVDFPALRTSLSAQLTDRLVRSAGPDVQSNVFGAMGLTLAGSLVGATVDAMVTPMGLGALMEGRKEWTHARSGFASDPSAPAPDPLHDAVYRYESPSRFTATIRDTGGRPIVFVLTRSGIRWRLSDIRLPQ